MDALMLNTLLCKVNLGHHWLAETDQDGKFARHCTKCGKVDRRAVTRSGRRAYDGPPATDFPEPPSSF